MITDTELERLKQKVLTLTGELGIGDKPKAALLRGDAKDLRKYISDLNTKSTQVQKVIKEAEELIDALDHKLTDTQAQVEQTGENLAQTTNAVVQLGLGLSALQGQVAQANAELDAIGEGLDELMGEVGQVGDGSIANAAAIAGIKAGVGTAVIPTQQSAAVAAAPTAAQFNAVVNDIAGIIQVLASIKAGITG